MRIPDAFRADSERIPVASIDVRHATPRYDRANAPSMTSGSSPSRPGFEVGRGPLVAGLMDGGKPGCGVRGEK